MSDARSLFDKIWSEHVIVERDDGTALLFVDRHLLHEGSRNAFEMLKGSGRTVRRPDLTIGCADHLVPTVDQDKGLEEIADDETRSMALAQVENARREKFKLFGLGDPGQGIVHVVGPEQGLTLPGLLMVCGDSHTSTHGALGALAFGIGSSEVAHVLATQTLWQRRPSNLLARFDGELSPGVTSKDLVLAFIGQIGAAGATGYVLEFAGSAIAGLSVEERMTICNMSIEAGARAGLIAPDDTTIDYLQGRPFSPSGEAWDAAVADWRALRTDADYQFDRTEVVDVSSLEPMVTWGTSPEDVSGISGAVPTPETIEDPQRRARLARALDYMGLRAETRIRDIGVDHVFIGSCTNARIEDLRAAAKVVEGRKATVPAMVVPGSRPVAEQAAREGLVEIFRAAGFQWRDPGCSMCLGMNGDILPPGTRCASTSNRNFEGRQGKGARTHLVSPIMAAAAAIAGHFTDVREML